jgi:hypothetical protein
MSCILPEQSMTKHNRFSERAFSKNQIVLPSAGQAVKFFEGSD